MKNRHEKYCKCRGVTNKKHRYGTFFLTCAGGAKEKINITWPNHLVNVSWAGGALLLYRVHRKKTLVYFFKLHRKH